MGLGGTWIERLYFGDNLDVLREYIRNESVDLIYLDPPFNSKRDYNLLFKSPKGHECDAQITVFEDTWHWGEQAEREFAGILRQGNTELAELMRALQAFLGRNDMMAYLTMMASRLLELHRVLKPTGSLYLHCDPTASHYLKLVLDGVFGKEQFRNEVIWKRTSAHSDAKRYAKVSDTLFFYTKTDEFTWNTPRTQYDEAYIKSHYTHVDKDGGRFRYDNLTKPKGSVGYFYELLGCPPPPNGWRMPESRAQEWLSQGKIGIPPTGKIPAFKRYLDKMEGPVVTNIWDDLSPINSQAQESLGYPTQKPLALLERIIKASSNEGDVLLDPFCGCGTAGHAAQKLKRRWVGIDITHLAIFIVERRLREAFPDIQYEVHGTPRDLEGAHELARRDKYQFQWWACALVGAQPHQGRKKGADNGIDGLIYFRDERKTTQKIIVSVKGGNNVGVDMICALKGVIEREKAAMGLFVTLAQSTKNMRKEAASAGFYHSPHFKQHQFPRLQILTIEGLLNGMERPRYPDMSMGAATFKKVPRQQEAAEQVEVF